MKLNRQELLKALDIVKIGLAKKELIEQSICFVFMQGKVFTYNDEISVAHPISTLDVTGAVKANAFYKLLNKITTDEVDLVVQGNELQVHAGRTKAGFVLQEEIKLPIRAVGNISEWKKAPDKLRDALQFTMFSCATDMSRPVLTCIYVHESGMVYSCDNYRVTSYNMEEQLQIKSFLLPAHSAKEIVKYDITKIAEGEGWVHFGTEEGTVISCRVFEDKYPNVSKVLNMKEGDVLELPVELKNVVNRAIVFTKKENILEEVVEVFITNDLVKVRAEGNGEWFEEEIPVEYSLEKSIKLKINVHMLKDILQRENTCSIKNSLVKFTGVNWEHVFCCFS